MQAVEQFFPVALFVMLYKVVLTFKSVDEILKCDHSNESYWAVLSRGAVCHAVQGGSIKLLSLAEILKCVTVQMKAIEQYFPVVLFITQYTWF